MGQGKNDCFERSSGPFIIVEMGERCCECGGVIVNGSGKEKSRG